MHFLYPSDPLRTKKCDEIYAPEFAAVEGVGFGTSVFSLEEFQGGSFRPYPPLPADTVIVYRGWMLSAPEYESLASAIKAFAAVPLTDANTYALTHYLPNWYPLLAEFTPETRVFPADVDLTAALQCPGWDEYFIKDYVKSLKTSIGSRISTPEQALTIASEMRQFRGKIEGGFCVRRVENFLTETEKRYFVMNSTPCSMEGDIPVMVTECAWRIRSPFFSVDVVKRADGELRIVEIGDGQVSDVVGWTPEIFAKNLANCFSKRN